MIINYDIQSIMSMTSIKCGILSYLCKEIMFGDSYNSSDTRKKNKYQNISDERNLHFTDSLDLKINLYWHLIKISNSWYIKYYLWIDKNHDITIYDNPCMLKCVYMYIYIHTYSFLHINYFFNPHNIWELMLLIW